MLPQSFFAEADTDQSTSMILTKKMLFPPFPFYKRKETLVRGVKPSKPPFPPRLGGSLHTHSCRGAAQTTFSPLVLHITPLSIPIRVSSSKSASTTHSLQRIGPAPAYKRGQCLRLTGPASPRQRRRAPGPAACARREAGTNEGPPPHPRRQHLAPQLRNLAGEKRVPDTSGCQEGQAVLVVPWLSGVSQTELR